MITIQPFKALRPQPELARQIASLPYDVLNSIEAKQMAQDNAHSFLHITKSEIDLEPNIDIHAEEVYHKAKDNLTAFIKHNFLFQELKDCYYIYQLTMNGRSQTGLVCVSSINDYEQNRIKKHEFTRPEKEKDRINHIATTGAQTGNVFLAYRNVAAIDALIEAWKAKRSPIYDFTADDTIQHTVWIVNDEAVIAQITDAFKTLPCTYIADGHHRAASAAKTRTALATNATAQSDYFLTTLFPASQLCIMDYNRLVKDLNGLSVDALLTALQENFEVTHFGKEVVQPQQLHHFGMYLDGHWYRLVAKPNSYTADPIGVLDVTILQSNVLDKLLGIKDPRTDTRIDFVGGIRGLAPLAQAVDAKQMAVAFSLYPVTIDQLFDIADSGQVMPPKSTWFEPKLRDGLLTHLIVEHP